VGHAAFNWPVAVVSTALGLVGIGLSYAYWFQRRFQGVTQRNKLAKAGYHLLQEKYGFDILYTEIIAGGTKGPVAKAAYWFNQNVIDGIVNGTGASAEGGGQLLRKIQSGKVQQYGALLFGGAVLLAGVLIFAI
jgi:NADH-quinone oxidoreductase subunit L